MDVGDTDPRLVRHHDLEKARLTALLHVARHGEEPRLGGHGRHVRDGHAHGESARRVAGGAEGDVRHGEDDTAVREAVEVEHVGPQRESEPAVAATDLQLLDAEGPGPGVVPESGRQLARNRLAGGLAHRMVAVRMKLDSLEACSCR